MDVELSQGANMSRGLRFGLGSFVTAVFAAVVFSASANAASWAAKSQVYDISMFGGKAFIGGSFTEVDSQPRPGMAALDAATGELTGWVPDVPAQCGSPNAEDGFAQVLATSSSVLVGHNLCFLQNGVYQNMGGFSPATGANLGWFSPLVGYGAMQRVGDRVIAIKGVQNDSRLVSIDPVTGDVMNIGPQVDEGELTSFDVKGRIAYIGGLFDSIGGISRKNLAAINLDTGRLTDWSPTTDAGEVGGIPNSNYVSDVVVLGTSVFFAGEFDHVNGVEKHGIASVGARTGRLNNWTADYESGRLVALGSALYTVADPYERFPPFQSRVFDAHTGNTLPFDVGTNASRVNAIVALGDGNLLLGGRFGIAPNTTGLRVVPQVAPTPFENDPTEIGEPGDVAPPLGSYTPSPPPSDVSAPSIVRLKLVTTKAGRRAFEIKVDEAGTAHVTYYKKRQKKYKRLTSQRKAVKTGKNIITTLKLGSGTYRVRVVVMDRRDNTSKAKLLRFKVR